MKIKTILMSLIMIAMVTTPVMAAEVPATVTVSGGACTTMGINIVDVTALNFGSLAPSVKSTDTGTTYKYVDITGAAAGCVSTIPVTVNATVWTGTLGIPVNTMLSTSTVVRVDPSIIEIPITTSPVSIGSFIISTQTLRFSVTPPAEAKSDVYTQTITLTGIY